MTLEDCIRFPGGLQVLYPHLSCLGGNFIEGDILTNKYTIGSFRLLAGLQGPEARAAVNAAIFQVVKEIQRLVGGSWTS